MTAGRAARGLLTASMVALQGCSSMLYQPSRAVHAEMPDTADAVELRSADGTALSGYVLRAERRPPTGTFVHFHGNAGNVTSHVRQLGWVTHRGFDLFVFDYRGYGGSEGSPTPRGVHEDAIAALAYARRHLSRGEQTLVTYGQSLGGAVMLRALGETGTADVAAVIVEGSFHSYQEAAASVAWRVPILFPFTGFAYLVSDEYAPAPYVASIAPVPLLVIHGQHDRVIEPRFGAVLHELAREPKELWIVPGGRHVDALRIAGGAHRERVLEFVERALGRTDRRVER